jgi:hypothetical protein
LQRKEALIVARWLEGARPLQPISVMIARSMPPEVRLTELAFERDTQKAANVALRVRINGGSTAEIDAMESNLAKLQYKPFSPQQNRGQEELEYQTTLISDNQ